MKKLFAMIMALVMVLSLTACGGTDTTASTNGTNGTTDPTNAEINQLDLNATYTTITAGVEMPDMYELDEEQMLDLYGIRPEYCNQAVVRLCVNSLRADELWLLEAVDAEAMAKLKTLLDSRLEQKDAESIMYDPEQNAIVKAAQIIEVGNYLVMIVSPDAQAIAQAFRTAAGI